MYFLIREGWGRRDCEFDLDHFQPHANRPELATQYENLVYACHTCNLRKSAVATFDPDNWLGKEMVRVFPDGRIEGLSRESRAIIATLTLDSPKYRKWRLIWIRNVELAREHDFEQYKRILSYPDDLPDLATLQPATNSRPEGVHQSYYALRSRANCRSIVWNSVAQMRQRWKTTFMGQKNYGQKDSDRELHYVSAPI